MNINKIALIIALVSLIVALIVDLIVAFNTYQQLRDIGSTFTLMELEVDSKLKAITEKLDAEIFKKSKELSKSSSYSTIEGPYDVDPYEEYDIENDSAKREKIRKKKSRSQNRNRK